jgi:hypothetical protein
MGSADWDLGQKLIEQGICTLDQVREVLSVAERLGRMGAKSKPLARLLLDRGYVTRERLRDVGIEIPAEPEMPRPAAPAPRRSRAPAGIAVLVAAGLGALVWWGRSDAPSTSTAPATLTPEEAERRLGEELDRLTAFAASSPDGSNAEEAIRRFEDFLKGQAGTKWEVEAHRRLKAFRERVETFAKAERDALREKEKPLRDAARWDELAELYRGFPARYLSTSEAGRDVKAELAEAERKGREAWAKERGEIEALIEAKKLEEAAGRAAAFEGRASAARKDEAAALRLRADRELRERTFRRRQELSDLYARKVEGPYREAMARRDGRAAARTVFEVLTDPDLRVKGVDYEAMKAAEPERSVALAEPGIPEAESPETLGPAEAALLDLRNAALLQGFMRDWQAAYQEALASGRALDLPTLGKGRFEKREGRTVYVAEGGGVMDPERHPLRPPDFEALARLRGGDEALGFAKAGFFYFYSVPELPEKAYEALARAQEKGVRGIRVYLGALAQQSQEALARELRTKFGAASDLFKAGRRPQAKRVLGELLEHGEHAFVKAMRPEIEAMLFGIAEGSERERRLGARLKARVTDHGDGRVTASYDFEGREQSDAFDVVGEEGARKFKGRWRLDRGALESSVEASVLRWKQEVKGDLSMEFTFTPLEEPQNIAVDLYYRKGEGRHYAAVFGFDWIGKPDGDLSNTEESRRGMPRTCVIKYPVAVDKSRWTTPEPWEAWKAALVGRGIGGWKASKGQAARIRIDRAGRSIRLLADQALIWEGEDADYGEGAILLFSDSRCRLDDLSITFTP